MDATAFLSLLVTSVATFFAMCNPFANTPIFMSMTAGDDNREIDWRARVLKRAINGDAERVGARLGIDRDQRALEPCGGQPSQNHVAERARIGRTKDGDRLRIEEGAEARGVAERVVVHGGERAGTA